MSTLVSARFNPSSCIPPSGVWTLLAKDTMISLKLSSLYCMAISAMESSLAPAM